MVSSVFVSFFQDLSVEEVPQFVEELNTAAQTEKTGIASSPSTISAIVDILNNVAVVSTGVNKTVMEVGRVLVSSIKYQSEASL